MGLLNLFKKKNEATDVERYQQELNARRAAQPAAPGPEGTAAGTVLLRIEDVFAITGRGTVVVGQCRAPFSVGDKVCVTNRDGTCHDTTVTALEKFRSPLTHATPGDQLGVLLQGLSKSDIIPVALLKSR